MLTKQDTQHKISDHLWDMVDRLEEALASGKPLGCIRDLRARTVVLQDTQVASIFMEPDDLILWLEIKMKRLHLLARYFPEESPYLTQARLALKDLYHDIKEET